MLLTRGSFANAGACMRRAVSSERIVAPSRVPSSMCIPTNFAMSVAVELIVPAGPITKTVSGTATFAPPAKW